MNTSFKFSWPDRGSCLLKDLSFHFKYDSYEGPKMISSLAYCFVSRLSWEIHEKRDYFLFRWVDEAIFDVVSRKKMIVPNPVEVKFFVDRKTGAFCGLVNFDDISAISLDFLNDNSSPTNQSAVIKLLGNRVTERIKQTWEGFSYIFTQIPKNKQYVLSVNESEKKNGVVDHCGIRCIKLGLTLSQDPVVFQTKTEDILRQILSVCSPSSRLRENGDDEPDDSPALSSLSPSSSSLPAKPYPPYHFLSSLSQFQLLGTLECDTLRPHRIQKCKDMQCTFRVRVTPSMCSNGSGSNDNSSVDHEDRDGSSSSNSSRSSANSSSNGSVKNQRNGGGSSSSGSSSNAADPDQPPSFITVTSIDKEVSLTLFCWDDVPQLCADALFTVEYNTFHEACTKVFESFKEELVRNLRAHGQGQGIQGLGGQGGQGKG